MVAVDVCRHDIINHGGIELSLQLLSERPCDYKTVSEISACERVQQKAAIALTRMCREEEIAQNIVNAQGMRIDDAEKNYSTVNYSYLTIFIY